jgi:ADP-ribosylglycohydrolase
MLGAIAGDIIGSIYEHQGIKTIDFDLLDVSSSFTDDTVLSVAIADAILNKKDYAISLREYGQMYPDAGYGWHFGLWLNSDSMEPYNSWGNGSAMRVSPVGFAFNEMRDVLEEAERTAEVTHNHPE